MKIISSTLIRLDFLSLTTVINASSSGLAVSLFLIKCMREYNITMKYRDTPMDLPSEAENGKFSNVFPCQTKMAKIDRMVKYTETDIVMKEYSRNRMYCFLKRNLGSRK